MNRTRPWMSRQDRRRIAQLLVVTLTLVLLLPVRPAHASVNLLVNPGLETVDSTGFPLCWEQSGWGANTYAFALVRTGADLAHKAPHLARHLRHLGLQAQQVLLVGDSVDDAHAARECGARCIIYHAGEDALHARGHFTRLGVPVVSSLEAAVEAALCSPTAEPERR